MSHYEPQHADANDVGEFFHVTGSHGDIICNAATGEVLTYFCEDDAYLPGDPEAPGYRDILAFDVTEWRATYPGQQLEGAWIDILDFCFHVNPQWPAEPTSAKYEHAVADWRATRRAEGCGYHPPA